MDTNKQNALADIEAMDMLKDSLYETNNDTKRATEWSEVPTENETIQHKESEVG